ncbi:MAG TPA: phenylalanine--tRNA ligase subunit beta [Myxococcota bacterium]|nr:phenylalanine--tRNA ligase subunit beta [Myxococcota bacterium]
MRVPLGWLGEWIDLPGEEELCERLTLAGLEIEEIVRSGPDLSEIRVGHVLERRQHPNADRLSLCRVDVGGPEPLSIVCGAPNVAGGQKVAVALVGTTLPDGTKLKKSKIRGESSEGMICSARELGLSDDHAGILVLAETAPVGAPLPSVLATGDTILDVEITPNRGDWVSMLGMAREVRALFGGEIRMPKAAPAEGARPAADDVRITIDAPDGCARYLGRVVRGVRVRPSPDWLKQRLEAAGMRSINNVVDATNLVLLELGQPLHAFDLATLRGGQVRVRRASAGEKLESLDGETRSLAASDLVIADAERAIALAGVIGGAETEVREGTTDLLIESAQFDPVSVRRSSRRLQLRSEASYRFERGVDRDGVARAADRCALLVAELAGGTVSRGRVEALGTPLPHTDEIALDPEHPNRLLGTKLGAGEVTALLARVGVAAKPGPGGKLACAVPSWRNDLSIPADLCEEVARIHGYDKIPATLPAAVISPVTQPAQYAFVDRAREALARAGLVELRQFPGLVPSDLDTLRVPPDDPLRRVVRIENPMPGQGTELVTTLLPGLLHAAARNLARQVERVRIFEVGRVFLARPGALPEEPARAAALVIPGAHASLWESQAAQPPFFAAKGIAEAVLAELDQPVVFHAGAAVPWLHPGASGELRRGDTVLCRVGELHPDVAKAYDIPVACAVLELDLDACLRLAPESPQYRDPSPYPAVRRDLAVLLDQSRPAGEVLEAIRKTAGSILASAEIFDRYEGKGVPAGKVSVAFRLVFQRGDRTLQDIEVGKTTERIVAMLGPRFGAELR